MSEIGSSDQLPPDNAILEGTTTEKGTDEKSGNININNTTHDQARMPKKMSTLEMHFLTWWFIVVQIAVSTALAVVMVSSLDGYLARNDTPRSLLDYVMIISKRAKLRVDDITTIISAVLVVNKLLISAWTAVTIWRCAYLLMEQSHGIETSLLNAMFRWRVPTQQPATPVGWMVAVVLLLLLPPPFINPLISGAVGWSSSVGFGGESRNVSISEQPVESLDYLQAKLDEINKDPNDPSRPAVSTVDIHDWRTMVMYTNPNSASYQSTKSKLEYISLKAAGMSSVLWGPEIPLEPSNELKFPTRCRRGIASYEAELEIEVGSKTRAVEIPCILVEDITWSKYLEEDNLSFTNISMFGTPLLDTTVPGVAVLFNRTALKFTDVWPVGRKFDFPSATTVRGSLSLLILLGLDVVKEGAQPCNLTNPKFDTIFGPLDKHILDQDAVHYIPPYCYAHATVNVTAGLVEFPEAEFVTNSVFEGRQKTKLALEDFNRDRWARASLMMLPDVMAKVAVLNQSLIGTWDNLDNYVETLISQSYMGSWSILHLMENKSDKVQVKFAEIFLRAKVSHLRVWTWFAIQMLVPLSGLIWYFGAHKYQDRHRTIILDPEIQAVLTRVLDDGHVKDSSVQETNPSPASEDHRGRSATNDLSYTSAENNKRNRLNLTKKDDNRSYLQVLPPKSSEK